MWTEHGVLVFRSVQGRDMQLALSRVFGELMTHPTREAISDHKELITVRYRPETGWLMKVDGELLGTWLPWHSDLIYVDKINRGGILRPIQLPSRLGETGFIDKIAAYASLPDRLKDAIKGLDVIYKYDLDPLHQKFGRIADVGMGQGKVPMSRAFRGGWTIFLGSCTQWSMNSARPAAWCSTSHLGSPSASTIWKIRKAMRCWQR